MEELCLRKTSISSHGIISCEPTETYGSGPVILRIGNGGAGATGLIRALAEDYLSTLPSHQSGSITWVCNHSRNTQLALLHHSIDIALTYERSTEAIAESEGWSKTFGCVFHDHFLLAGPEADPAGVKHSGNLASALLHIRELGTEGVEGVKWHARNDDSATMWKERSLWDMADSSLKPWDTKTCESWYQMSTCTPAEAIQKADLELAYLLTDRATLLRQTALGSVGRTTVFFEPADESDVLMNSCYALFSSEQGDENGHRGAFLNYIVGERGQEVVESFGVEAGLSLFAEVKAGLSKRHLRGGVAREGKWLVT